LIYTSKSKFELSLAKAQRRKGKIT